MLDGLEGSVVYGEKLSSSQLDHIQSTKLAVAQFSCKLMLIFNVIAESPTFILIGRVGGAMSGEREGRAIYLVDRRKCREWG